MSLMGEISGTHEQAARLIPWLVNGTISGDDAVRLRAHLAACPHCTEDYESEKRLYEAIRAEGPVALTGEPSFAKLAARIEADDFAKPDGHSIPDGHPIEERLRPGRAELAAVAMPDRRIGRGDAGWRGSPRRLWRPATPTRWLAAAVVLQAVCLGLLAWAWQGRTVSNAPAAANSQAPYRTLSSPSPRETEGARARVVFRAHLSLERMQELLQTAGAHIVDGPTEAHVYTLAFGQSLSPAAIDARIAALRASPEVLFAEPAGERPP